MTAPPKLFDRDLLCQRAARARQQGWARFLHDAAAAQLAERLSEVNRSFTDPVIVARFSEPWEEALESAGLKSLRILPDVPVLDLSEGAQDLVLHALSLHWSDDPLGALIQMRRALRPDGLMLAAMFGGRTLFELRDALMAAEIEITGGVSPRVSPMAENRDVGALLMRAGFALPVADSDVITVTYSTMFGLLADLRAMGETNALHERLRQPTRRAVFLRAAEIYADRFAGSDSRLPATFEIVWLTGWAPDAAQPKPLRPGSAQMRIADALGVDEQPTGDVVPNLRDPE